MKTVLAGLSKFSIVGAVMALMPATGQGDDFCVNTAFGLQDALTSAESNIQHDTIKVVQGTYAGNFMFDSNEALNLAIEGGYTEGCLERTVDPANTVLDGEGSGSVLTLSDFTGGDMVIEGLTIRNGSNLNGSASGGGVSIFTEHNITLQRMLFQNNSAGLGGGAFIANVAPDSALTIIDSEFTSNTAEAVGRGGGLYVNARGPVNISGSVFINNSSIRGGGGAWIDLDNDSANELVDNLFEGNSDELQGGGGLYVLGEFSFHSRITLTGNVFRENTASMGGAAILKKLEIVARGNQFVSNSGNNGGGLFMDYVYSTFLEENLFLRNRSDGIGGGISFQNTEYDEEVVFSNNGFCGNTAANAGGGFYFIGSNPVTLTSNSFVANSAREGGGCSFIRGARQNLDIGTAVIYNNIFWANLSAVGANDFYLDNDSNSDQIPSIVDLYNNDFDQSAAGYYVRVPFPIDPSNLDRVDPLLVDQANCDLHLQTAPIASPMINQGNNDAPAMTDTDLDGDSRIIAGTVDIGADEALVGPIADLDIVMSDDRDPAVLGENLAYAVTVSNIGGDTAVGVVVTDTLPTEATYVSATPQQGDCSEDGGVVICDLGTLANGATTTIEVSVVPQTLGLIENQAAVAAATADLNLDNNSTTETTEVIGSGDPVADIQANGQDDPLFVQPGTPVALSIGLNAGNRGGDPAEWWLGYVSTYGTRMMLSFQAPVMDLPQTPIMNTPLPQGWFVFFFSVDDQLDGQFGQTWFDAVWVLVSATGVISLAEDGDAALPDPRAYVMKHMKLLQKLVPGR